MRVVNQTYSLTSAIRTSQLVLTSPVEMIEKGYRSGLETRHANGKESMSIALLPEINKGRVGKPKYTVSTKGRRVCDAQRNMGVNELIGYFEYRNRDQKPIIGKFQLANGSRPMWKRAVPAAVEVA